MKTNKQFIVRLEYNIRTWGAMSKSISGCAQSKSSNCAHIIIWAPFIDDWNIKPHYQHQNLDEHCHQSFKNITSTTLYCMGATDYTWILDIRYMFFFLNHKYAAGIYGIQIPKSTGSTEDIIPLLFFTFGNQSIARLETPMYLPISLENMVAGLVLKNMLDMILPLRFLPMTLRRSSSVLIFSMMSNQCNPNFSLSLAVYTHNTLSNNPLIGIN